jgi:hypothetical protein
MEKSVRTYKLAETFCRQFERQIGSVMCRELAGLNHADAAQLKKGWDEHVYEKKCTLLVKSAVKILNTLGLDKVT